MAIETISAQAFHTLKESGEELLILDVREPWERKVHKIEPSLHMAMTAFDPTELSADKNKKIVEINKIKHLNAKTNDN